MSLNATLNRTITASPSTIRLSICILRILLTGFMSRAQKSSNLFWSLYLDAGAALAANNLADLYELAAKAHFLLYPESR
jgi:hypothetical protein